MAYNNFKETIWSKKIQQELGKICVLQEACNTQWQGEVGLGKKVKIIGATRPTVKTYTPGSDIDAAQTPNDTSLFLEVDQYKYTHFIVDDVDEAQSVEGLMEAYMKGSAEELAEERDSYIASLAANAGTSSASEVVDTAEKAKAAVDKAFMTLWNAGVRIGTEMTVVLAPWFYNLFKDQLVSLSTDNAEMIHRGVVGMYNGAEVKISNNLYNDGTDDYMMVFTKNAIAFAHGIEKIDAYRPEKQFADAVKILDTYGGKVVRPDELYTIKARSN